MISQPVTSLPVQARQASVARIQEVAQQIVERFDPERIILFGSYACGQPGSDSDVDMLVVMDTTGVAGSEQRRQVVTRGDANLGAIEDLCSALLIRRPSRRFVGRPLESAEEAASAKASPRLLADLLR